MPNKKQKFYFICYYKEGFFAASNTLINYSPLQWQADNRAHRLCSWQEVTKAEYEEFLGRTSYQRSQA